MKGTLYMNKISRWVRAILSWLLWSLIVTLILRILVDPFIRDVLQADVAEGWILHMDSFFSGVLWVCMGVRNGVLEIEMK